ncbi:3-hydroxyacyl-CoA dehydrogenase NAD-binding domain-containing protein [Minwuia thermotolerans]|uniref:enoyl-CoA hydratase n=1 Tax=Minwuia thermotolerans TaxID=2056226 RepID=A0A2M9FXX0_9PROT|nr:3-hydroxyacyl-CoA dehydrogenase NAD-binding domain-containing protein [Minwuia thermotolerans]PJK28300.1 fatty-acid oxidation protein subunit alpha [Minwuia thermotolerans]
MTGQILQTLESRFMTPGPEDDGSGFRHWRFAVDGQGIAWARLDKAGSSANTLDGEVLEEFSTILERLEADRPKGLVIRSAKPGGFCVGADIAQFREMDDPARVREEIDRGNAALDRLEKADFPTIAIIHGPCLGGGLELALACDYRIAIDGASFGFPEVMLGLHPGLGGSVRLTRLIDPTEAMTMMLTGKTAHTAKARKLGIVDAVTKERHVAAAVQAAVGGEVEKRSQDFRDAALNTLAGREIAARQMRAKTAKKAPPEHYPAPHRLIEIWRRHGGDRDEMREAEADSFAQLLTGETARNLIRVFFLRENLKGQAPDSSDVRRVHVVGAGTMGGDIAGLCAIKGLSVTLGDVDNRIIADAVKRCAAMAKAKHMKPAEVRAALDRLIPDPNGDGVAHADLVIEAGPEKAEIKEKIYGELEPRMKADAVLATNTSSLPLDRLAKSLDRPERFVGIHFFNPVAKMDLVEVVSHDGADGTALEQARGFLGRIGKLPAPVRTAPGFLVNRCLTPYLMEAIIMVDEGVKPETIDRAAERFGMPMGPIELADQVGLDIALSVADVLRERLDRPIPETPDWLRRKVDGGDLGRKSGRGFYEWKDGKADKDDDAPDPGEGMTDRLVMPMLDACATCLREGVVSDEDVLDGAMIFATGFAPFRGGPMHYARERGFGEVADALASLRDNHGDRFAPDSYWTERGD